MADIDSIINDNTRERERLAVLVSRLSEEDLGVKLPNGWTVAVALVHLAFWDWSQLSVLRLWKRGGDVPGPLEAEGINAAIEKSAKALKRKEAARMALTAAREVDEEVEKTPVDLADVIVARGRDKVLNRALHRQNHLDKIELALKPSKT